MVRRSPRVRLNYSAFCFGVRWPRFFLLLASRVRPSTPPLSQRDVSYWLFALIGRATLHEQKSVERVAKITSCSVYYEVYSKFSPSPELYCVEIQRHPQDLGISVVLPATCELMARHAVLRLFPEYKHSLVLMQVYLAQYAEIDWDSGRTIVVKQRRRPEVPPCVAAETKPERKKLPRLEDEGGVQ